MLNQNNTLIYIVVGILLLGSLTNLFKNAKDEFFSTEKMYTLEEAKLMLKHDSINNYDKQLELEYNVIEKENEKLKHDIPKDSIVIYNSSRAFRDSIRAELFAR